MTREERDRVWSWFTGWMFENAPHNLFDDLMSDREDFFKIIESSWHKASEKLPKDGELVIIAVKFKNKRLSYGTGFYEDGRWYGDILYSDCDVVIYWMPIPKIKEN